MVKGELAKTGGPEKNKELDHAARNLCQETVRICLAAGAGEGSRQRDAENITCPKIRKSYIHDMARLV